MLKNTFIHIPGIGIKTEQQFWESGIQHWNRFPGDHSIRFSSAKMDIIEAYLEESHQHFESGDPNYFSKRMPANLHWRFFPEFRDSMVYLDIETTGCCCGHGGDGFISLNDGRYLIIKSNRNSAIESRFSDEKNISYEGIITDIYEERDCETGILFITFFVTKDSVIKKELHKWPKSKILIQTDAIGCPIDILPENNKWIGMNLFFDIANNTYILKEKAI